MHSNKDRLFLAITAVAAILVGVVIGYASFLLGQYIKAVTQ